MVGRGKGVQLEEKGHWNILHPGKDNSTLVEGPHLCSHGCKAASDADLEFEDVALGMPRPLHHPRGDEGGHTGECGKGFEGLSKRSEGGD